MSETLNRFQWKIGYARLTKRQDEVDRLYRVLQIIKQAEEKHETQIEYTRSPFCVAFPELRAKTFREAAITREAHARLVNYFNQLISEISL